MTLTYRNSWKSYKEVTYHLFFWFFFVYHSISLYSWNICLSQCHNYVWQRYSIYFEIFLSTIGWRGMSNILLSISLYFLCNTITTYDKASLSFMKTGLAKKFFNAKFWCKTRFLNFKYCSLKKPEKPKKPVNLPGF